MENRRIIELEIAVTILKCVCNACINSFNARCVFIGYASNMLIFRSGYSFNTNYAKVPIIPNFADNFPDFFPIFCITFPDFR